jgi:isopentenyl phosphate kinase
MMKPSVVAPDELIFLKLGGSLITEKNRPHTPRLEVIRRLAQEIAGARQVRPDLKLLLGHGSGSFGHVPADKYGTHHGVNSPSEWLGFVSVWREASQLNRLVLDALQESGLPGISFPPSASVIARDRAVERWDLTPVQSALQAGLLPVVYGDVVFDLQRGGTIFSTEDLFFHLALTLKPERILLAGIEPGVWQDFPYCTEWIENISPSDLKEFRFSISGSEATDVTGGMASKVKQSIELVKRLPGLKVSIFSGDEPGLVKRALSGELIGTQIQAGF